MAVDVSIITDYNNNGSYINCSNSNIIVVLIILMMTKIIYNT